VGCPIRPGNYLIVEIVLSVLEIENVVDIVTFDMDRVKTVRPHWLCPGPCENPLWRFVNQRLKLASDAHWAEQKRILLDDDSYIFSDRNKT